MTRKVSDVQRAARERSVKAARLIIKGHTIRDTAEILGLTRTQVHTGVSRRMKKWNYKLYSKVQEAFVRNKQNGYVKSGEALTFMTKDRGSAKQEAIRQKAVDCATLIIHNNLTIREVSQQLDISRATVHVYVTKQLPKWYPDMAERVKEQLAINLKEGRSLGGYNSTKRGTK